MTDGWRTRLIDRYPDLFRRTVEGRDLATGCPSVEDGWRAIVETASARIAVAVDGYPAGSLTITQIKQKYGGLRIYTDSHGLPDDVLEKVEDAIDLAEARADCTCERCGDEGSLHDDAGWLITRCELHAQGKRQAPRPGWEGLLVKGTVVDGKVSIKSCRRYDRERDVFVDAPMPSDEED
jgi:hypothetical protein